MNARFTRWLYVPLLVWGFQAVAQNSGSGFVIPRTNSQATIQQTIASTSIEVNYNRPNKKNRKIFGGLVPYDQVWRTGSDEATKIYFSSEVSLEGYKIDSGKYELFTIPGENTWEIILQESNNQWGSYSYDKKNDFVRFSVTPGYSSNEVETFTIGIDNVKSNKGIIKISWDHIIVPIEVTIDLQATVVPKLEKALLLEGRKPYFNAAMFYYENDLDINRAAELIALALKDNPGHIGILYRQALILKKKGDIKEAIAASEESLQEAQNANPELRDEYTKLNKALLEELKTAGK